MPLKNSHPGGEDNCISGPFSKKYTATRIKEGPLGWKRGSQKRPLKLFRNSDVILRYKVQIPSCLFNVSPTHQIQYSIDKGKEKEEPGSLQLSRPDLGVLKKGYSGVSSIHVIANLICFFQEAQLGPSASELCQPLWARPGFQFRLCVEPRHLVSNSELRCSWRAGGRLSRCEHFT